MRQRAADEGIEHLVVSAAKHKLRETGERITLGNIGVNVEHFVDKTDSRKAEEAGTDIVKGIC